MHRYLKASGFRNYTEKDIHGLLWSRIISSEYLSEKLYIGDSCYVCEFRMGLNDNIGICAAVLYNGSDFSELLYYFPYYDTCEVSSFSSCTLERHTAVDTYAGIIDEYSIGISLIFFLTNSLEYRSKTDINPDTEFSGTCLSAFANEGTVILPVADNSNDLYNETAALNHEELLAAAMGGDEEAIETLTESELNMFQELSDRIETEDLYSVVEQSFMPCGVECDQYSIIGEILDVDSTSNNITKEELWLLRISCNDIVFRLCIGKQDLLGEPAKGRRIKCRLWMQGKIDLQNIVQELQDL